MARAGACGNQKIGVANIASDSLAKLPALFYRPGGFVARARPGFRISFPIEEISRSELRHHDHNNIAIEIEQMNFEHALGFSAAHGRANAEVNHTAM